MTGALKFIRDHIRSLPPYQPIYPPEVLADQLGLSAEDLIKLDANENPFGVLPEIKSRLAGLENVHIYPDPEARKLRSLLARYHQIGEESLVIGAGANELIDLIMRVVISPGDCLINCPPTFGMYSFDGKLNQARIENVQRKRTSPWICRQSSGPFKKRGQN